MHTLDSFHVPLGRHLTSGIVHHFGWFWRWLGNFETSLHRGRLADIPISKPIYVAGLARSGTSILIEVIASHADVATHQYRDFPFLHIPLWWRQTLDRGGATLAAEERAHGDRLMVGPHSPEAMEEMLWTSFFPRLHDPSSRNALDANVRCVGFERFYRDHLSKLLLITGRKRYAAKGNYNLTRLEYLLRLFPDARFVLPVRNPRDHIASLAKQHRLFTAAGLRHRRSVAHLDRVGHFEFGVHRRCINPDGNSEPVRSIETLWASGEEVRGWARYWAMLHRWILERLRSNDPLRRATLLLKYEALCDRPAESIRSVLTHCDLPDNGDVVRRWSPALSRPSYYTPHFTADEEQAIAEETREIAAELGYSPTT